VVAASSVLFAQNGGQGKLQDHASIRDARHNDRLQSGKSVRKGAAQSVASTANPFQWQLEEGIGVNYPDCMKKSKHNSSTGHFVICRQLLSIKQVMSVATNLPLFRKETAMDAELRFALHEKLLKESPQALAEFNEHLAGVLTPNIGGRKWDDELRKRQAKYAKAYCNSQNHARNCALCAFVLEINVLTAA
jgi:hypothetical protein